MIRFSCPTCGKVLKAPDRGGGREIPCPSCGQRLLIPPLVQLQNKTLVGQVMSDPGAVSPGNNPGLIAFRCPSCQSTLKAPWEKAGARTKCRYCRCPVQVPG